MDGEFLMASVSSNPAGEGDASDVVCSCREHYGNPNWPVDLLPEQHANWCPVRVAWLSGAANDTARVVMVKHLCQRLSPSAIPELRHMAKERRDSYRQKYPEGQGRPQSQYPFDPICDFIEEVMAVVGENGMMPNGYAVYDELRNYGRS